MAQLAAPTAAPPDARLNVSDRLTRVAAANPEAPAVVCARRGGRGYATITFAELDADATRLARGLVAWGVPPGARLALLVRPSIEFVTLVFALLRAGATTVFVDPGMGRRNLVQCQDDVKPDGIVGGSVVQAARLLYRRRFPRARWNVTVGRRWGWGGRSLDGLRTLGGNDSPLPATLADDPAAIIFTSGSTGPAKGVLYTHRMFDTQVAEIQSAYKIEPGGVDLACFPLFALFNSTMGVTTVLPEMNFSRPASADPDKLLAAANEWRVTQAFASPAVWRLLGEHCGRTGARIPTLRQIFSCGAPVPAEVLRESLAFAAPDAQMHTPYGATECLPVATIEAAEVLGETADKTNAGAGVCVGRRFDSIEWRVIRISDKPIATIADAEELPPGEIGELIVRGPQASPRYVTRTECNADAKIADADGDWHRMGDVGYFDAAGRFWYCGRKSQRVETVDGPLFTECVEAVFNAHSDVTRTALVGIGRHGRKNPVLIVECESGSDEHRLTRELLALAKSHTHTRSLQHVLFHPQLPVDVRHNAKINREQLAAWAANQIAPPPDP